eukprot:354306-Chlamydomonas_euryale.AAC.11
MQHRQWCSLCSCLRVYAGQGPTSVWHASACCTVLTPLHPRTSTLPACRARTNEFLEHERVASLTAAA